VNVIRDERLWRKQAYWYAAPVLCKLAHADASLGQKNSLKRLSTTTMTTRRNRPSARCRRQARTRRID
jgi:hypothetical protein